MSVRISAHDWMGDSGITEGEALLIARAFIDAGADIINVSTGQTSHSAQPQPGEYFRRHYLTLFGTTATLTIAVGNIYETDHVNSVCGRTSRSGLSGAPASC